LAVARQHGVLQRLNEIKIENWYQLLISFRLNI